MFAREFAPFDRGLTGDFGSSPQTLPEESGRPKTPAWIAAQAGRFSSDRARDGFVPRQSPLGLSCVEVIVERGIIPGQPCRSASRLSRTRSVSDSSWARDRRRPGHRSRRGSPAAGRPAPCIGPSTSCQGQVSPSSSGREAGGRRRAGGSHSGPRRRACARTPGTGSSGRSARRPGRAARRRRARVDTGPEAPRGSWPVGPASRRPRDAAERSWSASSRCDSTIWISARVKPPSPDPGQTCVTCSQSSGVSTFSGQNGQVRHWTGRAG